MKYFWDIDKIRLLVPNCINFTEVLFKLNIPRQGNNSKTLKNILINNNIDFSHFTGRARKYNSKETNLEDYLNNSKPIKTAKLKEKLIKEGIKENKCELCGISEWNNKPIICQLHHIDGNSNNNKLENLQILCPNCHSQTDNFCGAANRNKTNLNRCLSCNTPITSSTRFCSKCSHMNRRKIKRPEKEELLLKLKEFKSISAIGNHYGVSDNSIRKWFIYYNISPYKKDLLKLLN